MREILFRAKRKDNGEWVEGLLWKKKYNTNKLFISCFPDKDDNEEVFVIDPSTVCQFTGLTDKNGTKIFENDIVGYGLRFCVVRYDLENARYMLYENNKYKVDGFNADTMQLKEVIGNIFDNKEILQ